MKKLDLEDILEKEMDIWCQTSEINLSETSPNEINMSNIPTKISDNLLTNKISETIQNIKIKKQKDFYVSQMPQKEIKKSKRTYSKIEKECASSSKQDDMEVVFDEEDSEEDIFVISSKKVDYNISSKPSTSSITSSTLPEVSDYSNDAYIKENNHTPCTPLHTSLDTGQLARLKLSAFRYNQKSNKLNNVQVELNTSKSPPIQKPLNVSNIFSMGDEDDLSYLEIE